MNLTARKHSFWQNAFHFVWKPKYAKEPFTIFSQTKKLERVLGEVAIKYRFEVYELHVAPDHVHLFVEMPPTMSVSKALQLFKGYSSFSLMKKHSWLRKYFTKGHFWSPGKFFRSVGNTTSEAVQHYIESSQPWTEF